MNNSKEIKQILMGRFFTGEGGAMQASPRHVLGNGTISGGYWTAFFGVMSRERRYHSSVATGKMRRLAEEYLNQLGRKVKLTEEPETLVCFTGHYALTPTLIAVNIPKDKKEDLTVTVFTGRSPFGFLRCLYQFHRVEKKFGDLFERKPAEKEKK